MEGVQGNWRLDVGHKSAARMDWGQLRWCKGHLRHRDQIIKGFPNGRWRWLVFWGPLLLGLFGFYFCGFDALSLILDAAVDVVGHGPEPSLSRLLLGPGNLDETLVK